jgi:hypothetical protein
MSEDRPNTYSWSPTASRTTPSITRPGAMTRSQVRRERGTASGSAMDTAPCTVAVLYTNYDPVAGLQYTDMVQPFVNATALQGCASPNFYFQADSASSINTAMQQMFASALQQSAHLSQ